MSVKHQNVKSSITSLPEKVRIGTRGSRLARVQTDTVIKALEKEAPDTVFEPVVIKTSGDWNPQDGETPLSAQAGGKALFAKEIEQALLEGRIDIAVHSMKDMDSDLPEGLVINHMLPREDARDCIIFGGEKAAVKSINDIRPPLKIGTSSVRRKAFLKAHNSEFEIVNLRGNVETRLSKLQTGQVEATILALGGLKRLGLEDVADYIFSPEEMVPSAGQGAVGIEMREEDHALSELLDKISCKDTCVRVKAERAVLKALGGSCHTPIGVYATLDSGVISIHARMTAVDGSQVVEEKIKRDYRSIEEAKKIGHDLGLNLRDTVPATWL